MKIIIITLVIITIAVNILFLYFACILAKKTDNTIYKNKKEFGDYLEKQKNN